MSTARASCLVWTNHSADSHGTLWLLPHPFPFLLRRSLNFSLLFQSCRAKRRTVSTSTRLRTTINVSHSTLHPTPSPQSQCQSRSLVQVPVTCYQILGLPFGCTKDQVVKAAMELKDAEIDDGYSSSLVPCREELLTDVRDKIMFEADYEGNAKDNVPPKSSLSIPWRWLPAAMSLLQQVGEEEIVMRIGRIVMQEVEAKPYIHDIMLSMSLAECSIARKCFERGTVSKGFEALARAQLLLRSKKSLTTLTLLEEIEASLEELAPTCVVENLSLPRTVENAERREGALAALRELLRQGLEGEASCCIKQEDWPLFLEKVMSKLLAVEIVGILAWDSLAKIRRDHYSPQAKQQRSVIDFGCFYTALLAHIALGFSRKCPQLIESAKKMAESLERSEAESLSLETNVCRALLGEVKVEAVFDGPTHAVSRKPGNQDFNAALEKWLKDAALGIFVDTRDCTPCLVSYFGTIKKVPINNLKRVTAEGVYPQSDHRPKSSTKLSSSPIQNIMGINPVESLTFSPPTELPKEQDQVLSDVAVNNSIFSKSKNISSLKLKKNIGVSRKPLSNGVGRSNLFGKLILVTLIASSTLAIHNRYSWNKLSTPLPVTLLSSASKEEGNLAERIARAITRCMTRKLQTQAGHDAWPVNDLSVLIRNHDTSSVHQKQMLPSEAETLVREWQTIKAQALGPKHEIHRLSEILAEPMLSQWQELAESAKSSSCFWRFMLLNLSILHAQISYDDMGWEIAEVEAVLEEAAELIGETQSKKPNYYSTYRIRYVMKRDNSKRWKFSGGGIQSPA